MAYMHKDATVYGVIRQMNRVKSCHNARIKICMGPKTEPMIHDRSSIIKIIYILTNTDPCSFVVEQDPEFFHGHQHLVRLFPDNDENTRRMNETQETLLVTILGFIISIISNHFKYMNIQRNWAYPHMRIIVTILHLAIIHSYSKVIKKLFWTKLYSIERLYKRSYVHSSFNFVDCKVHGGEEETTNVLPVVKMLLAKM
ncbi:hypothetical protein BDA99DRAFT_573221 [Phascolomyces articulosus]|uniref:Uncharacterized protein n=1 Tax=Phascolomyces articulosus TaxID=60185 RepID=A0AAD5K7K4_9FUNG|nr:hypothetical protein BDA99DRAFT_573221 [Phascolomyces articulosus]